MRREQKTRALKCFRGNYDGIREGLVITNSQEKLRETLNCSQHEISLNWAIGVWPKCKPKPFTLYTRLYHRGREAKWNEGVCQS